MLRSLGSLVVFILLFAWKIDAATMVFNPIAVQGGFVKESGENSNVGDPGNTVSSGNLQTGDTAYNKQIKAFVSFDTSALPDDAYVTNAVLRLHRASGTGANPFTAIGPAFADINLSNGFGGNPALAASDFEARADGTEVAQLSNPLADGDWSEGLLDALGRRGINPGGTTQFRVYHIPDDNNDSTANFITYDSSELVVEYAMRPPVARPQPLDNPDTFHGLRTKWQKYFEGSGGATRASISPEMRGLDPARWAQAIERTGANGCTINVEARNNLLASAKYPIVGLTPELISAGQFTPDQRNAEQMRFLLGLQEVKEEGRILGSFRFHAHQRLYPNGDAAREQDFVDDYAGFINCAKAFRLDHWLKGIRLGENGIGKNNLWYTMDIAKWWAEQINLQTGDWLKTHGMEIHGARMGIFFNGIDAKSNSGTFFQQISGQTGYFAWCFKFFYEDNFNNDMASAGYDSSNVDDIMAFLRVECGFGDLKKFVQTYRSQYPMHANCIFVGDSGDAMKLISNKQLQALNKMFNEADAGFRGIVAVNGYSWEDENDVGDQYKTLYTVDPTGSDPVLNPHSYARWSAWPNKEAGATDPVVAPDAHAGRPFAIASPDVIDSGPTWLMASGGLMSGTPEATDLGVNAFRIRTTAGVEKTLLVTVLDQLHLDDGNLSIRTAPGYSYAIESTPDLSGSWAATGHTFAGDGTVWTLMLPTNAPAQFFRAGITH